MTQWKDMKSVTNDQAVKKKTIQKIVYSIFLEYAKLSEDDPCWYEKIMDLARDRPPKNFIYQKGILKFKKGNKIASLNLNDNPAVAVVELKNFIRQYGFFSSKKEISQTDKIISEVKEFGIKDIRKNNNLFEKYLNDYLCDKTGDYKYIVKLGFILKILETKDIKFENDKITGIEGIEDCKISSCKILQFKKKNNIKQPLCRCI
jgi:hypothetical protein